MISTYYSGREVFETHLRWQLKLWAKYLRVLLMPKLSYRCFHHLGGAKMLQREVHSFIQPGDFAEKRKLGESQDTPDKTTAQPKIL